MSNPLSFVNNLPHATQYSGLAAAAGTMGDEEEEEVAAARRTGSGDDVHQQVQDAQEMRLHREGSARFWRSATL